MRIHSPQFTGSVSITGSLTVIGGLANNFTSSNAVSASFASTASSVNQLNQNVVITGSLTVGSGSIGASENTLTLGARDAVNEGGQLGFSAPGGTYTSASMLDNYQNRFRLLRGTNAGSDAEVAWWSMHTKQMVLPAYTSAAAFPGTVAANLAVDPSGNIITVAAGTVTSSSFAATASSADNFTVRGTLTAQNIVVQTITSSIEFNTGSTRNGSTTANTHEFTGSVLITGSLVVTGSIAAASFTGSTNFNTLVNKPNLFSSSAQITGNIYAAGALFQFQDLTLGVGTTEGKISTDGGKPIRFFPTNNVESTRFLANGNIITQNGGTYSDNGYRLQVNGASSVSGSLFVSGSSLFSGSVNITGSLTVNGTNITSGGGSSFPFTGSAGITGSLNVVGNTTITGSLNTTSNLTITGGVTTLNNGTSNRINYGTVGFAAPTFTSYSTGVKLVLYDSVGASATGYTVGIEAGTMFFTTNTTSDGFKWYGGTTSAMTLSGAGILRVTGAVTASAFSGAGTGLTGTASGLSIGGNAATATTSTDSTKLPLAGGTLTGALLMGSSVAAAANSQPTALSYGLLQGYGTFNIAADTDATTTEYAVITAGYSVANATASNGLAVGFNTLAWKSTQLNVNSSGQLSTNFTGTPYFVTHRPTANVTFNIGHTTGNGATSGPFVNATVNAISDTTTVPLFFNCTSFHVYLGYSEAMRLTSGGALYIGSTITQNYSSWSDRKLKENLKIIANPLDKISKLTGYTFEWTKDSPYRNTPIVNRIQDAGLIAQDVEEILPEIVRTTKESLKTVNYDGVVALHTEGIKELIKQNQELLKRIKQLEEKLL